jgi:hypothetical protein
MKQTAITLTIHLTLLMALLTATSLPAHSSSLPSLLQLHHRSVLLDWTTDRATASHLRGGARDPDFVLTVVCAGRNAGANGTYYGGG